MSCQLADILPERVGAPEDNECLLLVNNEENVFDFINTNN